MVKKPSKNTKRMSVYSNLAHKRKVKKDKDARKKAEYLATLPKNPVKRFFYRLHPKRFFGYWFSKKGLLMMLKIAGVAVLLAVLLVGGLFAYYRKDLDKIRPGELAKRVQTTVTKYYDRNGQLLWEDKGDGNYKLVVKSDQISDYVKNATIAIEDRDFYKHNGISPSGLMRAAFSNARGGSTQGGSTLTQQLVKQVFFADEAGDRGLSGIPRKIKEVILSIEVERMYSKEEILALYLNESPYGGRRNGVQSASQTYFKKDAKDLTLAEAAMLAAIPNQPGLYDPYNDAGHEALIARQHRVLDVMLELKMITKEQTEEAKNYPILEHIQPASSQYEGIKAGHFIQYVRSELEKELGKATVGKGGLTITTTLDLRIQEKLEQEMNAFFASNKPVYAGLNNGAATVEDTQTGQIVAMAGSRSFDYPGYGSYNAATSYVQPGSTVKPFVFAKLFEDKGANSQNYGSGSILVDEPVDNIYGAKLQNWDGKFMGSLTVRRGLALSRNTPAVKAMYINGGNSSNPQATLDFIHASGAPSYCEQEAAAGVGLSSAIGACGVKQTDLVNAYATFSRMGVYKPTATVLEVKNSQGEVLKKFKDESKQIFDPQVAYIINDILADDNARAGLHGRNVYGLMIPGVGSSSKTGTSDIGIKPKDLWIVNYTPVLSMALWLGNNDATIINSSSSSLGGNIVGGVMEYAHKEVYAAEGKWKSGDWYAKPDGIQQQGRELYPSWWNSRRARTAESLTFDRVSKKLATECTPEAAKIQVNVTKANDGATNRQTYVVTDGYNPNAKDDVHQCDDAKPSVSGISYSSGRITVRISPGRYTLSNVDVLVAGESIGSGAPSGNTFTVNYEGSGSKQVTVRVQDSAYYVGEAVSTVSFGNGNGGSNGNQ